MKLSVVLITALAATFSGVAVAQTQDEINQQSCDDAAKAQASLTELYNEILRTHQSDTEFVQKMEVAQRAWEQYREAEADAIFPSPDKGLVWSAYPMMP